MEKCIFQNVEDFVIYLNDSDIPEYDKQRCLDKVSYPVQAAIKRWCANSNLVDKDEAAKDIFEETLERFIKKYGIITRENEAAASLRIEARSITNVVGYLIRIAMYVFLAKCKKAKRESRVIENIRLNSKSGEEDKQSYFEKEEKNLIDFFVNLIMGIVSKMREVDKIVFYLHYGEDLSFAEIAQKINESSSKKGATRHTAASIRQRHHRWVIKMRDKLYKYPEYVDIITKALYLVLKIEDNADKDTKKDKDENNI